VRNRRERSIFFGPHPAIRGRLRKAFSFDPEDFATIPRTKKRPLLFGRQDRKDRPLRGPISDAMEAMSYVV
jgi:hypothetical protein